MSGGKRAGGGEGAAAAGGGGGRAPALPVGAHAVAADVIGLDVRAGQRVDARGGDVLLEVAVLVLEREDAELRVDRDDPPRVPRAVALEVGLDDVAHREGVKGVGELDRDPMKAFARDVGLEVAVVVEHVDGVVVAVDREHLR